MYISILRLKVEFPQIILNLCELLILTRFKRIVLILKVCNVNIAKVLHRIKNVPLGNCSQNSLKIVTSKVSQLTAQILRPKLSSLNQIFLHLAYSNKDVYKRQH